MNEPKSNVLFNQQLINEVVLEARKRKKLGRLPFTYYYQKLGKIIGSFFCGDQDEDFILFFHLDYSDPSLILKLIEQHCQVLKEEILVYPLRTKGIELYETVTPENHLIIELL
ncbi:hypothetical protein PCC7424_4588 [Gloeothece citriformis PCC 7424]|uniref:Uncharacterized protein n=1 Tax=Gloeothece citriformis (strain PCC 7424) TaxID=65393 RepID=B7KAH6_GLOC7|nr:hypothetical protein [Gloeothece citriformis]ACK72950.1 hypothetical protein PCC7424_4588 [Gloeothece citriformis PCC 7424]